MTEQRDELQLVLLAQCDDPEAVEALFRRIQANLFRYVRGMVGQQQAEDVLQDVFVKLWRNLRWLEQPELFRPWAYRIASRTCFELLKRRRRRFERHDEEVVVEELRSTGNDGIPELLAGMEALLDGVSPASRAVLLLHYREDLAIEDAAAMSEHGAVALGKALDQMERARWRSVALGRLLVFVSTGWLVLTHVVFLFSKAPWLGPVFALTTLCSIVLGVGFMLLGAVYENTRAIPKAIELVGNQRTKE